MESRLLTGTTNADGVLLDNNGNVGVTIHITSPLRLVFVEWLAGNFDNGVDATLKSVGAGPLIGAELTIPDRTLLTITNGDDDAWYTISESGNGIVEQEIRLDVTSGGDGKVGGCRLYFDTVASNAVALAASDINLGNVDVLSIAALTTFYHGQKTVTTAGTELVLASTQAIHHVTIKALHANTGFIYVGKNPVTSLTGYVLDAGESVFVEVDDLADVFIDCSVNGEGVSYIAS